MGRYLGKRFAGFMIACGLLTWAFLSGDPASFPVYATTLGLLYGAYLGGQSVTDLKAVK
jgi:hypothetical protein